MPCTINLRRISSQCLKWILNGYHAFNDGNKRSSIALGAYFLELNGYDFAVIRFVREMENIAVYVAGNAIDKTLLRSVIASLIYEDDFSEGLKLELIVAACRFNQTWDAK